MMFALAMVLVIFMVLASVVRACRTKSRGPKDLQLEVGDEGREGRTPASLNF